MSRVDAIDAYQRGHRWLGFPLAVVYKFFEDQGNYLAAIVTYYGFLSLFPLLYLFAIIIGVVLQGHPQLQSSLVHSAVAQFPIIGNDLVRNTDSARRSGVDLAFGIVVALYGGLGVIQAGQNAFNRAWGIPRQDRPDPIHARERSLVLLPVLGFGVLLTTALSWLTTSTAAYLGAGARVGGTALSVLLNVAIFVTAFRLLTARRLSTRDVIVGAIIAGVSWQALQSVGTYYLRHALRGATATAGTFGVVIGLLAWIYLEAVITVLCVEVNVVLHRRLWPRALLSLVSDTDKLSTADRAAYTSYSHIERYKTHQDITVRFLSRRDPPAANGSSASTPPERPEANEASEASDDKPGGDATVA